MSYETRAQHSDIAVSSSAADIYHKKTWRNHEGTWNDAHTMTLDTRGRNDVANTSASQCRITGKSVMKFSEVCVVELTQVVAHIPGGVSENMAYLQVSFGQTQIERGIVEPWNIWYTEMVPLRPRDAASCIVCRISNADIRAIKYYNPEINTLSNDITLTFFTISAAGAIVPIPYTSGSTANTENFQVTLEINSFEK